MAFNVSVIFRAVNQFSAPAQKIKRSWKEINAQMVTVRKNADKVKQKFDGMGRSMRNTGAIMTAAITVPIAIMGKKLVDAASNATETQNKFNEVFKSMSKEANAASADFAKGFGVANSTAQEMISNTGDILVGLKLTEKQSLKMSLAIAELGSDLTSFKNFSGGAAQASTILTKALLGERESLVSLGLKISEEEVKTRALMLVKQGQRFATERQAKAQATLSLVMERSANAIGDTKRTFDDYANASRRLSEEQKELSETMGKILLPFALQLTRALSKLVGFFQNLSPATQKLILGFAAFLAILAPIIALVGLFMLALPALTVLAGALGTAFAVAGGIMLLALSPIGTAVIAVIAAIALLKHNWVAISDTISAAIEKMKVSFDSFLLGNPIISKAFDFVFGGEAKADININISDPSGSVDSVDSSLQGSGVNLAVGQNMAGAL